VSVEQPSVEALVESTRAICIGDTPLQQRCRQLADALERAEREAGTWKASRDIWAEEAVTAVARAQKAEAVVEAARTVNVDLYFDPILDAALTAYDEPPTPPGWGVDRVCPETCG
jgi:hypothetical protein